MIKLLERKFRETCCKHKYEIIDEFRGLNYHPHHRSLIDYYKLYCPYCDKTIDKYKNDFDKMKNAEEKEKKLQKKKEEIKKRVLGESK